jgi:hypothetical protein
LQEQEQEQNKGGGSEDEDEDAAPLSLCEVQSGSPSASPAVQSARESFETKGYAKLPRLLSLDACKFAARHFEALHTLEEEHGGSYRDAPQKWEQV